MNHAGTGKSSGRLTAWIGIGLVLGIAVGVAGNRIAADPDHAKQLASGFTIVTDIFLRLIKMIIAPLVFATIVSGIASFGNAKAVGGIALKAMGWFICASLVSLSLGMLFANLFQPGAGLNLPLPDASATTATFGLTATPWDEVVRATAAAVEAGAWLRPFRNLVYTMPPFICTPEDIGVIVRGVSAAVHATVGDREPAVVRS